MTLVQQLIEVRNALDLTISQFDPAYGNTPDFTAPPILEQEHQHVVKLLVPDGVYLNRAVYVAVNDNPITETIMDTADDKSASLLIAVLIALHNNGVITLQVEESVCNAN